MPSWANTFINPSAGGSYPWNNLSHYFNEMSNGTYQVIGDVYNSLVITDQNFDYYSSIGEVNREILLEVDPYVDFSEYDNLNGSSFGSDGKVDYVHIIYRNVEKRNHIMWYSSTGYYTAIARLELDSTIFTDGVQIVDGGFIGSGVQQRAGYNGRDYTMYTAAHEMGHYLFHSASHINYATNLCLMSGLPVWNGSRGMHSWEREKLGWINYTDKSTDGSVTLSDYMTTDTVYRVPVNASSEYFLIENRKKYSPHDKAADNGFYFYRMTNASSYPPTIDVLCADGNYDFSFNSSTKKITRDSPNPSGKDEMNYIKYYGGSSYACFTPHYNENSAWGDSEDAFDLTFNNVFSPKSNPRNTSSLSFTIEVTGTNTIQFYFNNPYAGKPSKPQNLKVAIENNNPKLTWNANTEPDITSGGKYKIYRASTEGGEPTSYSHVATVNHPTTSWIDINVYVYGGGNKKLYYTVSAVDNTNKESVKSDYDWLWWDQTLQKKQNWTENNNIIVEYSLSQNYPNPFNPTTTLSYQLPAASNVILKVFNVLGKEVIELVNENKSAGFYETVFDASNLPSGLYFYKIQAGEFTEVKKMLLTK